MVPSTIRTTSVVVQRRHFVVPNFDTGDGWDSLVSRVCVCVCVWLESLFVGTYVSVGTYMCMVYILR